MIVLFQCWDTDSFPGVFFIIYFQFSSDMTPRRLQACERAASSCAGQGRQHKARVGLRVFAAGPVDPNAVTGPFRKDGVKARWDAGGGSTRPSSLLLSIRVMAAGESCAWAETGCVASPADKPFPLLPRGLVVARQTFGRRHGWSRRTWCCKLRCWCLYLVLYRSSHESYGYGPSLLLHPGCCEVPKVAASKGARMMAQNATMSAAHSLYILQPQGTYFFLFFGRIWRAKVMRI